MLPTPAFKNINALWGAIFACTLRVLGVTHAVVSPGSRCTPLLHALANEADHGLQVVPSIDERTAAFFALGIAKATHRPVVLLCTSGTAAANYLPAVVEAWHAQVPLIIVTADRPPELQNCGAGQTIDQQHLYGSHVVWETNVEIPYLDRTALRAWQSTIVTAWERAQSPRRGPVHLNVPLRDPLAPSVAEKDFFAPANFDLAAFCAQKTAPAKSKTISASQILAWTQKFARGIIVAGAANPENAAAYNAAALRLAQTLQWPILADALNPLRHADGTGAVIAAYDALLRAPEVAESLRPDAVLQLGILPTSKVLRDWLAQPETPFLVLSPSGENLHPLGQPHTTLACEIESLDFDTNGATSTPTAPADWLPYWQKAVAPIVQKHAEKLATEASLFEGKIAWLLAKHLPANAAVFLANSMPVRDAEYFWPAAKTQRRIFSNRGANGIDGTLGTALGVASGTHVPTFLLTGDLSLLHDSNAFLLAKELHGSLTVILVNNSGGGIFQHLPVATENRHFERFWATPQAVDFAHLAGAHGVFYEKITAWPRLISILQSKAPTGLRIFEIMTNREHDARIRRAVLA